MRRTRLLIGATVAALVAASLLGRWKVDHEVITGTSFLNFAVTPVS